MEAMGERFRFIKMKIKELIKKWWFWVIIVIVIIGLVLLFAPLQGCGILSYRGGNGAPTGSSTIYISYFEYFTKGCKV
jgi:hypothetical protein